MPYLPPDVMGLVVPGLTCKAVSTLLLPLLPVEGRLVPGREKPVNGLPDLLIGLII